MVDPGRFWGHVVKGPGCWEWTAQHNDQGYAVASVDRKPKRAHRVAYELVNGPIPDGLTLDHLCRNRGCVNPAHLEPVTNRENVLRGIGRTAENARRTHRIRGHEFNERNTGRDRSGRYCRPCKALWARQDKARKLAIADPTPP